MNKHHIASALIALSLLVFNSPSSAAAEDRAENFSLPGLGDAAGLDMLSPAAERQLGNTIARSIFNDPDWIDDPLLGDYVQLLFKPLLAAARQRGEISPAFFEHMAWQLLLIKHDSVNAFALPGAYFGVHLGLLALTQNRDELASVLAHELSHVSQRHIARMLERDSRQGPLVIAAMIMGVMAARNTVQGANVMVAGSQALSAQSQLNYSRDMEREADRIGFGILNQAGFKPVGMLQMFELLQRNNGMNDDGAYPYLRSHPLNSERVSDVRARIALQEQSPVKPDLLHLWMAGRARVLTSTDPDAWHTIQSQGQHQATTPALYAAVLASVKLRDWGQADQFLGKLSQAIANPSTPPVLNALFKALQAERWLAEGKAEAALSTLKAGAGLEGFQRSQLLLRTAALLAAQQGAQAAEPLQTWVAGHPMDSKAWEALSQAWDQPTQKSQVAGELQRARALRARAQSRAALFDYSGAIELLRGATLILGQPQTQLAFIEASVIEARMRQFAALRRDQAAAERSNP